MSSNCDCSPSQCTHVTDQVVLTMNGMDSVAGPISQIKETVPYNRNQAESYSFYDQYLSFLRRPIMFKNPDASKLPIVPNPVQNPIVPGQTCAYPPKVTDPVCAVGKVALVVGASKNIGLAVALYLRCLGYRVIGTSRKPSAYTDVAKTVLSEVPLDIRDSESVKTFFDTVITPIGQLDLLVLCAGIGSAGPIADSTGEDAQAYFNLKPIGYMRCINAAIPLMRKFSHTRVICFGDAHGSMASLSSDFGSMKVVANHAVTSLTQQMNVDERLLYSMDRITNPITYVTGVPIFVRSTYNTYDTGIASTTNNMNPMVAMSNILQGSVSLGLFEPLIPVSSVKTIAEQIGDICLAKQPATMYLLGDPNIVYPGFGLSPLQLITYENLDSSTGVVNSTTGLFAAINPTQAFVNQYRMRMLAFFLANRP